jgi:trimeric autotransporter adhesin
MKNWFILSLILISNASFAQLSKTHYIPPITVSNNEFSTPEEQFLYVSTPSENPIAIKIKQLGSSTIDAVVSRNAPYILNIGFGPETQFIVNTSNVATVITNKGYIIEAQYLVYATVRLMGGGTNQAGQITSKGLAGLGKNYRIGAFTNNGLDQYGTNNITFASVLATENNTVVTFSDIKLGVELLNNLANGNNAFSVTLNTGESYVLAVQGPNFENRDGLIGAKITATKDVVVNCGSTTGSNGTTNSDFGIDQLVEIDPTLTENEYIFIRSTGQNVVEVPLLIADEDTNVFLNNNTTPVPDFTILAGNYKALDGSYYNPTTSNLYVRTDKPIYAFQSIGDGTRVDLANQNMFFVPPLSCQTPKEIDNIPQINKVGSRDFNGRVTIATKTGSVLTFVVNATNYTISALSTIGATVQGPFSVLGNSNFVTYTITGLAGNVSIKSTNQLYVAAYGSSGAATFGGYYSGFAFKPEISFQAAVTSQLGCIPNVKLEVSSLSGYDQFEWFYNGLPIGGNSNILIPEEGKPGEYYVKATLTACGISKFSDVIPVSNCPTNGDNDLAIDAIDIDFDNDGIANCIESYGDLNLNLTTPFQNINLGNYSNLFTATTTLNSGVPSAANGVFIGNSDGSFTTKLLAKNDAVTHKISFAQPISLDFGYVTNAIAANLTNGDAQFILKTDTNKSITVLDPANQLLIDTNYDGIYESGVTEYSSFEIRFKLKSAIPLAAGSGLFSLRANLVSNLSFTHINLSETNPNNASFAIKATCVPRDFDGDGVFDQFDLDADNDGILDNIELSSQNFIPKSNADLNRNGLDDAYDANFVASNSDLDAIPDFLDSDSDNDLVFDLFESGGNAIDVNHDGIIDGSSVLFGANGLLNTFETGTETGLLNYQLLNFDADALFNFVDFDSDGDGCNDLIEAAISATNFSPNSNYAIGAPIVINTQPATLPTCYTQSATIGVTTNTVDGYQWELSTDNGTSWNLISNNSIYSNSTTANLGIAAISFAMTNHLFRVKLSKNGNSCGLISDGVGLSFLPNPTIAAVTNLLQCDNDTDGISVFNLTEKNNFVSSNYQTETFRYFKTENGAKNDTTASNDLISEPLSYTSGSNIIYVRVQNADGCFSVGQLNLIVSVTQINLAAIKKTFEACDDKATTATDGISEFDFSEMKSKIEINLPGNASNYAITFFANQLDALTEQNDISNSTAYNNTFINQQDIWVRIDSAIDNSCFGLGVIATLIVQPLPKLSPDISDKICLNKPEIQPILSAGINDGTAVSNYSFIWKKDGALLPQTSATIQVSDYGIYTVEVSRNGCSSTRIITVIGSDIANVNPPIVTDLSDNNSIKVSLNQIYTNTTAAENFNNFEYSLDLPDGPFQESPLFENVSFGEHIVYINDINGCGIVEQIVYVIGSPNFFTPNGDGINDTWNIRGVDAVTNAQSIVYVYDRFGKLLKQVAVLGEDWDGTISGKPLPADDYWYMLELQNGRIAKGHFSLKR